MVPGLLFASNALNEEIVLRYKVNEFSKDFRMNQRFTVEINLEEKKLYLEIWFITLKLLVIEQ